MGKNKFDKGKLQKNNSQEAQEKNTWRNPSWNMNRNYDHYPRHHALMSKKSSHAITTEKAGPL